MRDMCTYEPIMKLLYEPYIASIKQKEVLSCVFYTQEYKINDFAEDRGQVLRYVILSKLI